MSNQNPAASKDSNSTVQWWGPMTAAVLFRLAIVSLLTLVVIPVLSTVFACNIKERMAKRFHVETHV